MVKKVLILLLALVGGCALHQPQVPASRSTAETVSPPSAEKQLLRTALQRRMMVGLWLYLSSEKTQLEEDLRDPTLTILEREVLQEMLVQVEEQQRLTMLEIGDD